MDNSQETDIKVNNQEDNGGFEGVRDDAQDSTVSDSSTDNSQSLDAQTVGQVIDLPPIPDGFTHALFAEIAAGGDLDEGLAKLNQVVAEYVQQNGWGEQDAARASQAFIDTLVDRFFNGSQYTPSIDAANEALRDTLRIHGDVELETVQSTDALVAAIASGGEVEQTVTLLLRRVTEEQGVENRGEDELLPANTAFIDTLQEALNIGVNPELALAEARQSFIDALAVREVVAVSIAPADNLIAALSNSEKSANALDNTPGGDNLEANAAFIAGLEAALAEGIDPQQAIIQARETAASQQAQAAQQSVPVSPADQLISALADSDASEQAVERLVRELGGGEAFEGDSGADAFAATLEQSLASGESSAEAVAEASGASESVATQADQQSVPVTPADALVNALADADSDAAEVEQAVASAGGGDAAGETFVAALEGFLAAGEAPQQAVSQAAKTSEASNQQASQQSVPVAPADQLVAALADGESAAEAIVNATEGGNPGESSFMESLTESLAESVVPEQAVAQAKVAEQAVAEQQAEQSVPVSQTDQVLAGLADVEQIEAAQSASGVVLGSGGKAQEEAFVEVLVETLAQGTAVENAVATAELGTEQASQRIAEDSASPETTAPVAESLDPDIDTAPESDETPIIGAIADVVKPQEVAETVAETTPEAASEAAPYVPENTETESPAPVSEPAAKPALVAASPVATESPSTPAIADAASPTTTAPESSAPASTPEFSSPPLSYASAVAAINIGGASGGGFGSAFGASNTFTSGNGASGTPESFGSANTITANPTLIPVVVDDPPPVNQAPILSAGESVQYRENSAPLAVPSSLTVIDSDAGSLVSASATISSGLSIDEDRLSTDASGTKIVASYDSVNGVLSLSGADSVANYQQVLRSISYQNLSDQPTLDNRQITLSVNDGELTTSNQWQVLIKPVNDAPIVRTSAGGIAYVENDSATVIDSALTLADVDDMNLTSATIRINSGHQSSEDALNFTNTVGITGVYDSVSGVLSLSGIDTIANYQAALRSVSYRNSSETPSTSNRVIDFVVNDSNSNGLGNGTLSGLASRSIMVSSVNDTPLASNDVGAVNEDATLTVNAANGVIRAAIADSDLDGDALSVTAISGVFAGTVGGVTNGTFGTLTLNADGSYNYVAGNAAADALAVGSTATDTFTYTLSDGEGGTDTAALILTVTGTNDAPTVTAATADQTNPDNASGINVNAALAFNDVDTGNVFSFAATGLPTGLSISNAGLITGTIDNSASQSGSGGGTGGIYHVVVTATDAAGTTVTDTIVWIVTNPAPTATNDTGAVAEDASLTINAANGVIQKATADSDFDGDALTVSAITGTTDGIVGGTTNGTLGTLSIAADGSYSYIADKAAADALGVGGTATDTFTYTLSDGEGGADTATLIITITGTNDIPTLASFTSVIDTVNEDTEVELTFAALNAQGDEADIDGTVDSYIVQAVSSGSLKIGTSSVAATAFVTGTNDTISGGLNAYWTASANANGTLNAFTVKTQDDDGGLSSTAIQAQVSVIDVNDVPTLTAFTTVIDTVNEDTEVELTFTELNAQGNEADIDGVISSYVVQAVTTGALKIGGSAGTATAFAVGTNDTISSSLNAYWTPVANVNGTLNAFAVKAQDDDGGLSTTAIQAQVSVTDVNDVPTLTAFTSVIDTVNEDTEVELTFTELNTQGNEADIDGMISSYVVQAVTTGTLKIGGSVGMATAFAVGTNDTISSSLNAYWTPVANANGTLNAFTVKAQDDDAGLSATAIQAQVSVTDVNDVPTLTAFTTVIDTVNEDTEVELTFVELNVQGDAADIDGTVNSYIVQAVSSGTLTIGASAGTATAFAIGTNDTIDTTLNAYWTAETNANGTLNVFTVKAQDDDGDLSTTAIQAQVSVTDVNDVPTLTAFTSVIDAVNEDTEVELTFAELNAQGNEADIDGVISSYVVQAVTTGALKIGGSVGTATAFAVGTNDTISSSLNAYWTPVANANGTLNAFTVKAQDDDAGLSVAAIQAQVSVTDVNDVPTLTAFTTVIDTVNEDTEVELTFAELNAQGDEADIDGTVNSYIVQAVSSGTLTIGANAGTATAFAIGTNDTIDATLNAYWTAETNANGTLNAFTVKAQDDDGDLSTTAIQAQVSVTDVNDVPTLTAFTTVIDAVNEDTEVELTFAELNAQGNEADVDGTVDSYIVQVISSGALKIGISSGTATAFLVGSNDTISSSLKAYWTPVANANGTLNAFSVKAKDNDGALSATAIQATISVTAQNDSPTLSSLAGDTLAYIEGAAATIIDQGGDAALADIDSGDLNGGNLTVSIVANKVNAEDVLSVIAGNGITLNANEVQFNGNAIGDIITNGTGANDLVITFDSANATPTAISSLIKQVGYQNSNATTPDTSTRSVRFTVNDGDGATSGNADVTITIAATNDDPLITPSISQVATFDGTDDHIKVSDNAALDGFASMTVEAWIQAGDVSGIQVIASKFTATGDQRSWQFYLNGDKLSFNTTSDGSSGTNIGVIGSTSLVAGRWYHVAGVYSGSELKLYVDGSQEGNISFQAGNVFASSADMAIGARFLSGTDESHFVGQIRDVRLWSDERSQTELQSFQNQSANGEANLVVQYVLGDSNGTAVDTGGSSINGSYIGGVEIGAPFVGTDNSDIPITGIVISDVDAGANTISAIISIGAGKLTAATVTNGATSFTNNSSGSVTISGTVDQINATLSNPAGLLYRPAASGDQTLTVTVNDGGNIGLGGGGNIVQSYSVLVENSGFVPGKAIELDGTNDLVTVGRGTGDNLYIQGDLTVEAWFRSDVIPSGGQNDFIVVFGDTNGDSAIRNTQYGLGISSGSGALRYIHEHGSGINTALVYDDAVITAGQWYHAAIVRNVATKSVTLYLNGRDMGTQTYTTGPSDGADSFTTLDIGGFNADGGEFVLNGAVDEVRIWNDQRTAAEIRANYNQQISASSDNLVSYFRFDENTGTVVHDLTGNDDGELKNGASFITSGAELHGTEIQTEAGQPFQGSLQTTDLQGYTFSVATDANDGIIGINANGDFTYTPNTDFRGSDSFTLRASDGITNFDKTFSVQVDFDAPAISSGGLLQALSDNATVQPFDNVDGGLDATITDIDSTSLTTTVRIGDADSLVGQYSFRGNANDLINSNNGTVNGATLTTDRFGNANSAYHFDGVNDRISIADSAELQPTTAFTLSAWIKLDDLAGAKRIITKFDGSNLGDDSGSIIFDTFTFADSNGGGLRAIVINSADISVATADTGTVLAANTWYHVATTFNNGSLQIYLDGQALGAAVTLSGGQTSLVDTNTAWTIGEDSNPATDFFEGSIDDVRIYHRTLDSTELSQIANDVAGEFTATSLTASGFTDLGDGTYQLSGQTPADTTTKLQQLVLDPTANILNNGDTSTVNLTVDVSDGTVTSQSNTTSVTIIAANDAPVVASQTASVRFDGEHAYAQLPTISAASLSGAFTLEAWVMFEDNGDNQRIFDLGQGTDNDTLTLLIQSSGKLVLDTRDTGTLSNVTSNITLETGRWYHVAGVNDGFGNAYLYINGVLDNSANSQQVAQAVDRDFNFIGHSSLYGNAQEPDFKGQIRDARIWNDARDSHEIKANLSQSVTGQDNLVATYQLNESSGTTLVDSSGNALNGVFKGDIQFVSPVTDFSNDTINVTGITLSDVDAAGNVTAIFSVAGGTLTLKTDVTSGITVVTGNGSASISVTDTVDKIQATLNDTNGLLFTSPAGVTGNVAITVSINDGSLVTNATHTVTLQPNALEAGGVLQFDGVDDYVSIADNALLDLTTNWTIEFWAFVETGQSGTFLERAAIGADTTGGYSIKFNGDALQVETSNNGGGADVSDKVFNGALNTDAWNHISVSFDNGTLSTYVDGVLIGTQVGMTAPSDLSTPLLLGRRGNDTLADNMFEGLLDDIRLWDITRTANEIESNFEKTLTGNEQGLVGYYRADETSGAQLEDITGNGLTGTLVNGSNFVNTLGKAISLDGVDDYISITDDNAFGFSAGNAFTLETWVYLDDLVGTQTLFDKPTVLGSSTSNFRIQISGANLQVSSDSSAAFSATTLTAQQWHHVAAVYTGTQFQFYLDGAFIDSANFSHNGVNSGALLIGRSSFGDFLGGKLDEVRIWNDARSANEIRDNYNQQLIGTEANLVANYRFDDGTATDFTGSPQNGTLIGGATIVDTAHVQASEEVEVVRNSAVSGFVDSNDTIGKTYALSSNASNGTVTLDTASGHWIYTPTANYSGIDSFAVTYSGGGGASAIRHYDVEVNTPQTPEAPTVRNSGVTQVASFDGTNDRIQTNGNNPAFDLDFFTLEAWIRPENDALEDIIFGNINVSTDTGYRVNWTNADKIEFIVGSSNATDDINFTSVGTAAAGEWNHIAVTYDGIDGKIYINGGLDSTQNRNVPNPDLDRVTYDNQSFVIGNTNTTSAQYYKGLIDNVRVWDHARTVTEISRDYDKLLSGSEDGLVALYQFDESSGTTFEDSTGNGNDLVGVNGVTRINVKTIDVAAGSTYKGLILGTDGTEADSLSYSENTDSLNRVTVNADGTFIYDASGLGVGATDDFSVNITDGVDTHVETVFVVGT